MSFARAVVARSVRLVRAHAWIVMLIALGGLAGSIGWLIARPPAYEATAEVLTTPLPHDDDVFLGLPLLRDAGAPSTASTAVELLDTQRAARETARRLGGDWTAVAVRAAVKVEPREDSQIVMITARAGSPRLAARIANAFATSTVDVRDAAFRSELDALIRDLRSSADGAPRRDALSERLAHLQAARLAGDPTVALAELAPRRGTVVGPPPVPVAVAALAAGLLLCLGAALLAARRGPRRLRDEEELAAIWPVPVLARLPAPSRYSRRIGRRSGSPSAVEDLAYRALALALDLGPGTARCVMVTSATPAEGKTNVAANLALRLASERQPVVAMDLDLLNPRLALTLGAPSKPNLASALENGACLADAASSVRGNPFLRVVPGVRDARISTVATLRDRLPGLLTEARWQGSHVIVDAAPLGGSLDALTGVNAVDELVVVARIGWTSASALEAMRELLERSGGPVSGLVLVGAAPRAVSGVPARWPLTGDVLARVAAVERPLLPADSVDGRGRGSWELAPGDRVWWRRGSQTDIGIVEGRLTAPTMVGGRRVRASEAEPRYLVRNERSGKHAARRARALSKLDDDVAPPRPPSR